MSQKTFGFLAVLVLALLLSGSAQAQGQDDWGWNIAGAWLGEGWYEVDIGCDGSIEFPYVPVKDAHMFGVGGDVVTTNPANPNSSHGTWTRTGPRQISAREINFGVDSTPNGTLLNRSIISLTADFDKNFESATTTFGAKVYLPDVDPLDPDSTPFVCTSGQHDSFRKVSATE